MADLLEQDIFTGNTNYRQPGKLYLDVVEFNNLKEALTAQASLRSGEGDVLTGQSGKDYCARVAGEPVSRRFFVQLIQRLNYGLSDNILVWSLQQLIGGYYAG